MLRLVWCAALALAACGAEVDVRPRTTEYITAAILAPNCGNAQCHSQFRQVSGIVLDTIERARPTLVGLVGPIGLDANGEVVGDAAGSRMINVLTRAIDPMPYDRPLPDVDIDLIARWIDFGAPGAQCDPAIGAGKACVDKKVVECRSSFDYGAVLEDCGATGKTCAAGACR
jgi:hypothetical protein